MRIIITRHGKTEENKEGIIQGHLPGVLSDLGKEQARKLAERLKNEKIGLIVSSDLARAADTAREVGKFHSDAKLIFDERMREANFGSFQGMKKGEIDWKSSEIESRRDMAERTYSLALELLEKYSNKTVLLVGHAGINKALIGRFRENVEDCFDNLRQGNTCLNILEISEDRKSNEILLNCMRHLDED
jgi:broad specificity phosphatase PhoE